MKKNIYVLSSVLFVLCLASCGNKQPTENNTNESQTEIATVQITEAATEAQPQQTNKGIVSGKFEVEIVAGRIATDYQGNPAAIVTYNFMNNGDSNAAFLTSVGTKAFQNSIQCGVAVITSGEMDTQPSLSEVQPGGSITVECAYSLQDTTNPVTIQVGPYINISGEIDAQMILTFD